MKIFSQNAKMKKSGNVWNFGIPAFQSNTGLKTCPNAGVCVTGCYAKSGAYVWSNVQAAYEARLALTQSPDFIQKVSSEIIRLLKKSKGERLYIRVHDSGDFYSEIYQRNWYAIASMFQDVSFYAYTKQIEQSNNLKSVQPSNFQLIYSFGGKQDALIQKTDRHAAVFNSDAELVKADYVNASNNDLKAIGNVKRIGLVYHGVKKFSNTLWNRQGRVE